MYTTVQYVHNGIFIICVLCSVCDPVERDEDDGKTEQEGEKPTSRSVSFRRTRRRRCLSLDNHNPWYESLLDERKNKSGKNFIKSNIVRLQQAHGIMQQTCTPKPLSTKCSHSVVTRAIVCLCIYSCPCLTYHFHPCMH